MGCSATKNMAIEPLDGSKALSNGTGGARIDDTLLEDLDANASVNIIQKNPNGMSFEITFDEDKEESIIQKHPPKRLQKLEEEQTSPQLTLDKLQEKLEEAEKRREQILQLRVQSAKMRNNLRRQSTVGSNHSNEDNDNLLAVPKNVGVS